jgi:flagellar motor switch protein FliM
MAEYLSQEEINQVLITVNGASNAVINHPDKFSKEQLLAVSYIHETFANLTTYSLSAYMRSMCYVRVSSVDELVYDEFIRSTPALSTLAAINMNPLKGSAILEINSEITFAIIDRLCGGSGDGTIFQHGLTEIEKSIMDNIIVHMFGNLREAWNQVLEIHPKVKAIHTDPQSVRIVSPNETVILVTLETKIREAEGIINICIPSSTIEPIMEKLTNWYWNKNQDNTQSASSVTEKPSERKSWHIPKEKKRKKFRPFYRINRVEAYMFLNFIQSEHPQIIALVLAHMKPDKAAIILLCLPLDMQSDVFRRITVMDWVRDEIVSEIERVIENMIIALSYEKNCSIAGGIESAAKIFNRLDKASSKQIIDKFEKEEPDLLEEILKRAGKI